MRSSLARLPISFLIVAAAASTSACDAILGLDEKTLDAGLVEGGTHEGGVHDAAADREAGEASLPSTAAVAVSSSYDVSGWCAVRVDGSVWCWGDNEEGELGRGATEPWVTTPTKIEGLPLASQVVIAYATVCALTRQGGVYCWGYGADGELGNGSTPTVTTTPVPVSGLASGVTLLSAGGNVTCAIKADGSLWCWGLGGYGQLGTGSTANALTPVQVKGFTSGVTSVSVGQDTTCAVRGGKVSCWGGTSGAGELGNGTDDSSFIPVEVSSLNDVSSVALGELFECALTEAGAVFCWGLGQNGQLGDDNVANSSVPVQVSGLSSGVVAISAGMSGGCAIKANRSVVCWGTGDDGELGNGVGLDETTAYQSETPVKVLGISAAPIAISTGSAPCVVTTRGSVECWGLTAELALTPVPIDMDTVSKLGKTTMVSIGGSLDTMDFVCELTESSAIACWGGNGRGQLSDGTTAPSNVPVNSECALVTATALSTGAFANFACGVTSGLVKCWGDNNAGQLGTNGVKSSTEPLTIPGLADVATVGVGASSACALTNGGAVWCWGNNSAGQLGNDSTTSSATPVEVQGLTSGVASIAVGNADACAVLTSGTLMCWGDNNNGKLGDGTQTTRLVPVPVSGITNAVGVSLGWYSGCAVTLDGTVECWGDNTYDELGNDTVATSLLPLSVGIPSGATAVSVGQVIACAIIEGGVSCWGTGPLGSGYYAQSATPIPVTGLTSGVTAVSVGVNSSCAILSGQLQCWGSNSAGQLGIGAAPNAFEATPVAGFP